MLLLVDGYLVLPSILTGARWLTRGLLLGLVQRPINPYGLSKKMAEDMIRDFSKANPDIAFAILR